MKNSQRDTRLYRETNATFDSTHMDAAAFLDLIHGPDAPIYFQVGGKTWKNKPQTYRKAAPKLAWRNAEGDGVCFVVNAGGTKDAEISRINACFLDWDAGRGPDDRYLDDASVTGAKAVFRDTLDKFSLRPSIMVETRNGFHAYWLLNAGVSVDQFRDCQRRLAQYLGGDPVTINPARLMRLPGYDWTKQGYVRFPVYVVFSTGTRYAIEDLSGALPALSIQEKGAFGHHNKAVVDQTTALIVVSKRQPPVVLSSMADVIKYLKTQSLADYLGIKPDHRGTTSCPFHADTTPSATVAQDTASGHWLFCCHSTRCGVKGSIIDLTMRIMNTTDTTAVLRHLMERFNAQIDTGWKVQEEAILEANMAVISSPDELKVMYPSLYRWIGKVSQDLCEKLLWAKSLLISERLSVNGRAIFFLSLREMERRAKGEEELPRQFGRQSQRVDRYCLLGLMRKLSDGEIPATVLKAAREYQGRRTHRIQFYCFPAYTADVLKRADERACKLIEAGASVRGVSRQLTIDLFGQKAGAEVYPQRSRCTQGISDAFMEQVESVVTEQIAAAGFVTVRGIRGALAAKSQSLTHRRIERVLPGILARRGLVKVTANQAMKDKYNIGGAGYPKVIVPGSSRQRDSDQI